MLMDGLTLHFIKNEICCFALGAKIEKIYLPTRNELVLCLRTRTEAKKLFINVAGNAPRINLTSANPENPPSPPMLCMLFRKQLAGAVITDIRQQGLDRVLMIDMSAVNEIGDRVNRTLAVEIMAQYSNCILLDENGVIIDALKRVDSSKSSVRLVLPGEKYSFPPAQDKLNIITASSAECVNRVLSYENRSLSGALLASLSGFSPLVSKELAYRVTLGDPPVTELSPSMISRLEDEICSLSELLRQGNAKPCYYVDENGEPREYSFMPLTYLAGTFTGKEAAGLSDILDLFFSEREKLNRAKTKAEGLFKSVDQMIERTSKKINNRREELLKSENADEKRIWAELINANLYRLQKGSEVYELENYYDNNNMISVPVRVELSPAQNAQRYFKEYRKLMTAKKVLAEQLENGAKELDYLMSVRDELSRASTEKEISEIRNELAFAGFLKNKSGTKNKKNSPLPPLEFTAPSGKRVLVGRNNTQNDSLTHKKAAKTDMWFHAQKAPGSHVILCLEGEAPDEKDMEFAASVAAFYSSVKSRGTVEVDYTQVKNIKKPPSSLPGFVIYHVYSTMYIKAENPEKKEK